MISYASVIKDGVRTVHKNWPLIFIQFLSMLLVFMSFFIIVGIPIAIAFIIFGLDLTDILKLKDLVEVFKNSTALLQKYFATAVVILLSIIFYMLSIVALWAFTLGGIIGSFSECMLNTEYRFSLKTFVSAGKRFFFPVLFFSTLIGAVFIVIAFVLGLFGGIASTVIEAAKTQEVAFALFLGVFFSLVLFSAGVFLVTATLSMTAYGIAYLAFKGGTSVEVLKGTAGYLYAKPGAVAFYALLMVCYAAMVIMVVAIGSPLTFIPIIGPILTLPYQLLTSLVQGYAGLLMLASAFHYFKRTFTVPGAEEKLQQELPFEGTQQPEGPAQSGSDEAGSAEAAPEDVSGSGRT